MHGLADASAASASSQHFLQRVRCTQCSHMPPPPVPASRQFLHWNRRAPCSQMPPPPVPASQHVLQRGRCAPTRPCYFAEGTPPATRPAPRALPQPDFPASLRPGGVIEDRGSSQDSRRCGLPPDDETSSITSVRCYGNARVHCEQCHLAAQQGMDHAQLCKALVSKAGMGSHAEPDGIRGSDVLSVTNVYTKSNCKRCAKTVGRYAHVVVRGYAVVATTGNVIARNTEAVPVRVDAMQIHVWIASNATWRRSRVLIMLRYARRLCRQQACGRTQSLTTFES